MAVVTYRWIETHLQPRKFASLQTRAARINELRWLSVPVWQMPDMMPRGCASLKRHFEYVQIDSSRTIIYSTAVGCPIWWFIAEIALVFRHAPRKTSVTINGASNRRNTWDFYEPLRATSSPRHTSSAINATVYRARAESSPCLVLAVSLGIFRRSTVYLRWYRARGHLFPWGAV